MEGQELNEAQNSHSKMLNLIKYKQINEDILDIFYKTMF